MLCRQCNIEKSPSEFASRGNGKLHTICKRCKQEYNKALYGGDKGLLHRKNVARCNRARALRHLKAVDAAKSVPCADCNIAYPPYVMDFDHRPGSSKSFTIGANTFGGVSMARLEAEMSKCDVVCANCHRIRTYERRKAKGQSRRDRVESRPSH